MFNKNKLDCCGCQKCKFICPTSAIETKSDETGFIYPKINDKKCLSCNLCDSLCSFKNRIIVPNEIQPKKEVYAAKNISEIDRINSRSGGVFTIISDEFINNGDTVYGCLLDDKWNAKHDRAIDLTTSNKFRGSKYVQSNIESSYDSVKKDLNNGHRVLFSGTPCQVDAISSYVKTKENLYTLDVICYGVPSPQFWADYIKYIECKHNGSVEEFNFRDKIEFGWKSHNESYIINKKKYYSREYSYFFKKQLSLRPSCYQCPYKSLNRVSDITLGDFWGIDKICPQFDDNKGVSLIIINTNKGQEMFDKVCHKIIYKKFPIDKCIQPSLVTSSKMPEQYVSFWNDYVKNGFLFVLNKYYDE